ncbi:hypothetical protein BDN67DRAFT_1012785 [Paxillus ammoniavirescens]|nr:hypothetical protein BDN67DRAFT_1012785 [Paxillus ammoniavirescens]
MPAAGSTTHLLRLPNHHGWVAHDQNTLNAPAWPTRIPNGNDRRQSTTTHSRRPEAHDNSGHPSPRTTSTAHIRHENMRRPPGGVYHYGGHPQPTNAWRTRRWDKTTPLDIVEGERDRIKVKQPPRNPVGTMDGDKRHPSEPTEPPDEEEAARGGNGEVDGRGCRNKRVEVPGGEGMRETR